MSPLMKMSAYNGYYIPYAYFIIVLSIPVFEVHAIPHPSKYTPMHSRWKNSDYDIPSIF